jgi:hypothetical protein
MDYIYDWTPLPSIKVTQVGRKDLHLRKLDSPDDRIVKSKGRIKE